jgi:UDP-N-acetylglucosamine 2-epimerase (non-hydrolysing)
VSPPSLRCICVAGARPNYMKVKPVMDALERRGAEVILVHTGQHYDAAMNDVFFSDLGIRRPDFHLGAGSGTHAAQTARVMTAFEPLADELRPDVVIVVGDVNSTMACALVTAKSGALLAHVEAGLRSRDWSMPEEVNRVVTDRLSDYLFAPSDDAVANLRDEGYRQDQIHLVGNVMVDTLLANLDRAIASDALARLGLTPGQYGLVTLHRPANVDDPAVLEPLLSALDRLARSCPLVLPVHPRTAQRLRDRGMSDRVQVIPPAGYLDFIALEASARLVLTDSGGVQEETTALGVPCLTLRDNTERPITVTEGTNQLAGRDPERILAAALSVLDAPPPARSPALWDGHASDRIASALLSGGGPGGRMRPTGSQVPFLAHAGAAGPPAPGASGRQSLSGTLA